MTRLEIGIVSLEQYLANHTPRIELFEHFHAWRSDKFLWIFFIDESLTKSMKGLDIDPKCISTYEAPESLSHSKSTCLCICQSEDISRGYICFCENVSNSQGQKLSFTSSWSCYDCNRPIESVYGEFLCIVEARISRFKRIHRIQRSVSKRRGKSRLFQK